jgi:FdhD protein
MERIEAFILAGGASSRMGTDKSRLRIAGQTFTERIAEALLKVFSTVTIVGQTSADPRLKSAVDIFPQWGALGGLHASLAACKTDWAFVVACDLPFVSDSLFKRIASSRIDCDAVVPLQRDGRPQPLCGIYRIDPCLKMVSSLIEAGKRRPLDLLQSVKTCWLPFSQIEDLDQAETFFLNINTPEDYYEATRRRAEIEK